MVLKNIYVIARSGYGRPTLQHLLLDDQASVTACGLRTHGWSRHFMTRPIREVLCLRCGHGSLRANTQTGHTLGTKDVSVLGVPA